ncbi:MAG: thiol reductant ABC exporter subunit CydC [Actinomycetaceae bacterium]|nr:thiol reductant ABC exporter subunit CydC [Actinomycetaceae bacterium]
MIFIRKPEKQALARACKLLQINKKWFGISVLFGSLGLGAAVSLGATSAWLIARASQMPPVLTLSVAATAVRLFGISRAVLRYLERLSSHWVALEGMGNLRSNVYEKLADSTTASVAGIARGDLLARTGADVDAVGDFVIKSVLPATVATVVGVFTCLGIALVNVPSAILLALCLLTAGVIGPIITARATRRAELIQQRAQTEISATTLTMIEGAGELAILGRDQAMRAYLAESEEKLIVGKNRSALPMGVAAAIDNLAMSVATIGAIVFGIAATLMGQVSPVMLAVIVLTPLAAFEGTALMGMAMMQLVRSAGAARRIMDLLDTGEEDTVVSAGVASSENNAVIPQTAHSELKVVAKNLAIGWPGGPVVACGIDLEIGLGSRTAIVGPSGIGKTTLLFTLAGMLEPKAGSVTINGRNASSLGRAEVSEILTVTPEDAHIFETSVLENVRVARGSVTEDECRIYLEKAGLKTWLEALPEGLETIIGSGGTTISGGERRRLLLARALAAKAPLMLLDEPGEHIDPETADRLVADLLNLDAHAAGTLIVTHRLTALGAADEVIMLGPTATGPAQILARGRHEHLIATNSEYAWALDQEQIDV